MSILIGLDGSPLAEKAVAHAAGQLQAGEKMVLLRVLRLLVSPELSSAMTDCTEPEALAYLDALAAPWRDRGRSVQGLVRCGNPQDELVSVAREQQARLLVLRTHGRSGLSRWAHGSVAEHVAREAPCPVWLLREGHDAPAAPASRIAVPLDTSRAAEEALPTARELLVPGGTLVLIAGTEGLAAEQATQYLNSVVTRLRGEGVECVALVCPGAAVRAVVQTALAERVDLIVMTTHGRQGPTRWLLGSVAEEVARTAPCPVVLVRPSGRIWSATRRPR